MRSGNRHGHGHGDRHGDGRGGTSHDAGHDAVDERIERLDRLLVERDVRQISERAAELGLPLLPWQVEHLRWLLRTLRTAR